MARTSWCFTLAVALVAFATAACQARARAARAPGRSPALFNREIYGFTTRLGLRAEARRYRVIVLQTTDAAEVPVLRRYNRHLVILMYQGILKSRAGNPQLCTNFASDLAHPDWFLRGASGDILTAPSGYEMDVGNPAYQRACFANAVALAKAGRFDGIYLDGVDASSNYGFPKGENPAIPKYPSGAAWQAAMSSLLGYGASVVHAHGLRLVGNIGGASLALWRQWAAPLDGAEEEFWTDGGSGVASWLWWWHKQLGEVAWSEAHQKLVLVRSPNTTRAGNVYGLASMLLVANGQTSYSTANANYYGYEAWYPEYGAAQRLGAPLGGYRRLRNGVYERRFAAGVVLVNASTGRIRRFSLRGRYSGSGLKGVRSVSMGPASALILLRR